MKVAALSIAQGIVALNLLVGSAYGQFSSGSLPYNITVEDLNLSIVLSVKGFKLDTRESGMGFHCRFVDQLATRSRFYQGNFEANVLGGKAQWEPLQQQPGNASRYKYSVKSAKYTIGPDMEPPKEREVVSELLGPTWANIITGYPYDSFKSNNVRVWWPVIWKSCEFYMVLFDRQKVEFEGPSQAPERPGTMYASYNPKGKVVLGSFTDLSRLENLKRQWAQSAIRFDVTKDHAEREMEVTIVSSKKDSFSSHFGVPVTHDEFFLTIAPHPISVGDRVVARKNSNVMDGERITAMLSEDTIVQVIDVTKSDNWIGVQKLLGQGDFAKGEPTGWIERSSIVVTD